MKLKAIISLLFLVVVLVACQSEEELTFARYYSGGMVLYQSKCQNCHGSDGKGLAALIPPLTQIKTKKTALACLIKYGSKKSLNSSFDAQMPANDLPPVDIAKVLTYVTNSFGNKMGTIDNERIEDDLKKCK